MLAWLCGGLLSIGSTLALAAASVTLAWNPSTNSDVAGYSIYYGVASHIYDNAISVGNVTNATISGLAGGVTYYFAAKASDTSGALSDFSNEASYAVPLATNQPPTLDPISNVTINENAAPQTVSLTGITSGATNEIQTISVTALSSNPALLPTPAVLYISPDSTGTLTFQPAFDASGTATITVTVNNGQPQNNTVSRTFTVTVNAVNQPPTLDPISNLSLPENAGQQNVGLTGISSGAPNEFQNLSVSAVSSNTRLIPNPSVKYTSPNTTGTLAFTPKNGASGTAIVTVAVNDHGSSDNVVRRSFSVTVASALGAVQPTNSAPLIVIPPTNTAVAAGQTATFSVQASAPSGTSLLYQWQFNSANLPLATNASLTLTNVTRADVGSYSVTVSDNAGATNSGPAMLTVYDSAAAVLGPVARTDSGFVLSVSGVPGYRYVVEASTNLSDWVPLQTNTAPFYFSDPNASLFHRRFYRSLYLP
ncbi:MAG: immunoglobulin domain-containing protein [Verrucomicrobiota bacterium]|nr:immunoglobulin domain-containing protein [Verrucomicrobiota bacterium]